MELPKINWELLAAAEKYYLDKGYIYVEVPYYVPKEYCNVTFKTESTKFEIDSENKLVGSAEQSFIHLALNNKLKLNTKYFAITPCFRDEKDINNFTLNHFIKLELFSYHNERIDVFSNSFIKDAQEFFKNNSSDLDEFNHSSDNEVYDINMNGIEIGSYGIRFLENDFYCCFGTGLALPRFTEAKKVKK